MSTLRSFSIFLAVGLVLGAAAGCGDDDGGTPPDASPSLDAGVDAGLDAAVDAALPDPRFDPFIQALQADLAASPAYGVSVAVMENGMVTFAAAFGSKDPDGLDPLTPSTLMQIGSTTKQMTATALLRQVEAGRVTLDATLEATLPAFELAGNPLWDDQITLRHLITHQGAFYDLVPWGDPADDALLASYTYGTFAEQVYVMAPPGAFWNYSNPNFVLAGLVTEVLEGRVWADLMQEDLFQPLGMDRTFLRKTEVEADGDYALSYGYGVDDLQNGTLGPVAMPDMPDPGWARPAGLVWSTPTQMMEWARFILDGNPAVLSDELRGQITTEQVDTLYLSGNLHYGYGMFVTRGYLTVDGTWYPVPVWDHGGNTMSFTNIFHLLPEQGFAVAICTSGSETDFSRSLDAAITTLVDLPDPTPAPEYVFDASEFPRHVGTYSDPWNVGDVIVTLEDATLLVEAPTLTQLGYDVQPALVPVSSELFLAIIDGVAYDLTFIPLVVGGPSQFIRNRAFVATRAPEVPPPAIRPPLPVTRAQVDRALARARRERSLLARYLRPARVR